MAILIAVGSSRGNSPLLALHTSTGRTEAGGEGQGAASTCSCSCSFVAGLQLSGMRKQNKQTKPPFYYYKRAPKSFGIRACRRQCRPHLTLKIATPLLACQAARCQVYRVSEKLRPVLSCIGENGEQTRSNAATSLFSVKSGVAL